MSSVKHIIEICWIPGFIRFDWTSSNPRIHAMLSEALVVDVFEAAHGLPVSVSAGFSFGKADAIYTAVLVDLDHLDAKRLGWRAFFLKLGPWSPKKKLLERHCETKRSWVVDLSFTKRVFLGAFFWLINPLASHGSWPMVLKLPIAAAGALLWKFP